MWISRIALRDAAFAGGGAAALSVYMAFRAPELWSLSPHPAWAAVLLVAAAHGNPGLLAGLLLVGAGVATASAAVGEPLRIAALIGSGPDLTALGVAVV